MGLVDHLGIALGITWLNMGTLWARSDGSCLEHVSCFFGGRKGPEAHEITPLFRMLHACDSGLFQCSFEVPLSLKPLIGYLPPSFYPFAS